MARRRGVSVAGLSLLLAAWVFWSVLAGDVRGVGLALLVGGPVAVYWAGRGRPESIFAALSLFWIGWVVWFALTIRGWTVVMPLITGVPTAAYWAHRWWSALRRRS